MVTWIAGVVIGQSVQDRMAALGWMVGNWKGSGWQDSAGKRTLITCREIVEFKAGGAVIAITDYQATKGPADASFGPEREAYFQITFESGKHVMRGYTARGLFATFEPKVSERTMEWEYPQVPVRMHLTVDENGKWVERAFNGKGDAEKQEFELVLEKVKAQG